MCWALFFCSVRFVFRVSILCFSFFVFNTRLFVFCRSISIWFFQNVGLHVLACAFLFYQVCRFFVFWHVLFFFFFQNGGNQMSFSAF